MSNRVGWYSKAYETIVPKRHISHTATEVDVEQRRKTKRNDYTPPTPAKASKIAKQRQATREDRMKSRPLNSLLWALLFTDHDYRVEGRGASNTYDIWVANKAAIKKDPRFEHLAKRLR